MAASTLPPRYWLVGADGSVYSLGSAGSFGSLEGQALNKPVVAMAATPDGLGCCLVAAGGGIFSFGDALFRRSLASAPLPAPIAGIAMTRSLGP